MTTVTDNPEIVPEYITVGHLFEDDFIFRVPKYQRGYAWGDSQLSDFMSDLGKCYEARSEGARRHHLFGGIVSAEGPLPGPSRKLCDLIDGQQRLATFIIFVSHLVSSYTCIAEEVAEAGDANNQAVAETGAARLTAKYLEYEYERNRRTEKTDRFEFSSRDQQFFKDTINGTSPEPKRDSHQKLKYAFELVGRELKDRIDSLATVTEKLNALKTFETIMDEDCTVIHIVADSKAEAYRLFQVLNDRGTNLTEGDLLRARTLEILASPELAEQQKAVETAWDEILEDAPEFTTDFLMWFYASVMGKRPKKTDLFDEFLDAFFPQHEKSILTKTDAKAVVSTVRKMQREVAVCRRLVKGIWPTEPAEQIKRWDQDRLNMLINALEHKLCMPLLLAAASALDQKKFLEIVQLLERFTFRYKNISSQHVGSLTKIYHDHSVTIRNNPSTYRVSALKQGLHDLQVLKAPDSIFAPSLTKQLVYHPGSGNKVLRYFLITIEYYNKWYKSGASGNPKCRDKARIFDFQNTTIEHIYPLKPEASAYNQALEPLANDLGNLTFFGPDDNDTLANKDYATKRPAFAASSIEINREIGKRAKWGQAAIKAREKKLTKIALKVFNI